MSEIIYPSSIHDNWSCIYCNKPVVIRNYNLNKLDKHLFYNCLNCCFWNYILNGKHTRQYFEFFHNSLLIGHVDIYYIDPEIYVIKDIKTTLAHLHGDKFDANINKEKAFDLFCKELDKYNKLQLLK